MRQRDRSGTERLVDPATEAVEPASDPATEPRSYDLRQPGPTVVEAIQSSAQPGFVRRPQLTPLSRIYISRRGTNRSAFVRNEDDVEASCYSWFCGRAAGSPVLDEQVTIFARARVIAGPHGAGLNNAICARQVAS